jgi:LmbE family N-acetylglucosaminyl deacetylase
MIADCCFLSGLAKIETRDENGNSQQRWKPAYVLHYIQDWYHEPDLLIDISDVFDQRMKSIEAYSTQFYAGEKSGDGPQTYISTPDFLESIIARARMFGKRIGVKYAEGFISEKTIGIKDLDALIINET